MEFYVCILGEKIVKIFNKQLNKKYNNEFVVMLIIFLVLLLYKRQQYITFLSNY